MSRVPGSDCIELDERDRAFAFFFQIPIELSKHVSSTPPITMGLMGLCVLSFGLQLLAIDGGVGFALDTSLLSRETLYQVVTSAFLHGGFLHLAGNMYFLYAFGRLVEDGVGEWGFLLMYLTSAVISSAVYMYSHYGESHFVLGASGAVSGVLGIYLALYPFRFIGWSVYFKVIKVPAFLYLMLWFFMQTHLYDTSQSAIAHESHLGGFAAGFLMGVIMRANLLGIRDFFVSLPDLGSLWRQL